MATKFHVPETKGDTSETIDANTSAMQRSIAAMGIDPNAKKPQFFRMKAQLPKKGRAQAMLATTDRMWMAIKTYAADGENKLHTHTNEDHSFIVLQGRARFYGPNGESTLLTRNEGIMLPRGTIYSFMAEGGEPLVVLRTGCVVDAGESPWAREDDKGNSMLGNAKENNTVKTEFLDAYYE